MVMSWQSCGSDDSPMQIPFMAPLVQVEVWEILAAATAETTDTELVLTPLEVIVDCTTQCCSSL